MQKFRIGDKVKILNGRDKGREGTIEKIFPKVEKVVIPGINVYKKHVKGGVGQEKGGIYDITKPVSYGKFVIICDKCKKPTRISFKLVGEDKVRICAKCKKELGNRKDTKKK